MTGPVDWDLARRVAVKVASRSPYAEGYDDGSLEPDFSEFTTLAEGLVADTTGLRSLSGDARARVVDRDAWIDANIASFQRLLRPLFEKFEAKGEGRFASVGKKVSAVELGTVLGWMSTRVLGQYDLLVVEEEDPEEQDIVYYVGPNLVALEQKFAFPPREFRLWLALHEVTHRAQFTGVPWMREHYLGLVEQLLDSVDPDPNRLLGAFQELMEKRKSGGDAMEDGGVMALLATPEQRLALDQVAGLMSLLEGHGDVTMDRAGEGLVHSAERFGRVLRNRRQQSRGLVRLFQRVIGLDAKVKQYAQGEDFIAEIEAAGGTALLDRAWEAPENLPSIAEIRAPDLWIERMGSDHAQAV